MKIGIIGAGNIGSSLARLWSRAGHEIMISSRHPDALGAIVEKLGINIFYGTVEEAAMFGDVIVLAVPIKGIRDVEMRIKKYVSEKILIDTMNPFVDRDGDIAQEIIRSGRASAEMTQERFSHSKVVRAFSNVYYRDLLSNAHRKEEPLAIPCAANNNAAKQTVMNLIRDAGFEPLDLGTLAQSKPQDPEGKLFGKSLTVRQSERVLGEFLP